MFNTFSNLFNRSCTCPQCRCKVTEKTIHRIYFNVANAEGITDDVVTLQHKMDNLDFQIKLKDKDIQIGKDKNKKLKDQNFSLRYTTETERNVISKHYFVEMK